MTSPVLPVVALAMEAVKVMSFVPDPPPLQQDLPHHCVVSGLVKLSHRPAGYRSRPETRHIIGAASPPSAGQARSLQVALVPPIDV